MSKIRSLYFILVLVIAGSAPERAVAQQDLINQLRAWAHDSDSGIAGALIRNFVRQPDPVIITPGGANAPALSKTVLEGLRANATVLCAKTGTAIPQQDCEKNLIATTTSVRDLKLNAVQFCAASGQMMSAKECAEFPESKKAIFCATTSTHVTQRECLRYERGELLMYPACLQLISEMKSSGKPMPEVKKQDFRTKCGQYADLKGSENWFPTPSHTFSPAPAAPPPGPQVNCQAILNELRSTWSYSQRIVDLSNTFNRYCLR